MLGVPPGALIKAFPVFVEDRGPVLVVVRGDHRLNEIKLQNALGAPAGRRRPRRCADLFGAEPGFIGPVGAQVEVLADEALRGLARPGGGRATSRTCTCAASSPAATSSPTWADVRRVEAGRPRPDGGEIRIEPAIEVGNIFKLGTRYSEPLGATLPRRGRQGAADLDGLATASGRRASWRRRSSSSPTSRASRWPRALAPVRRGAGRRSARTGEEAARRRRPALRRAARRRARRALRRPRRRARARSSPTPSCSAARCG